jgi:hypothetical protein
MLFFQIVIFEFVGIIPLPEYKASSRTKAISLISTIAALCILIGTLYSTAFQGAVFLYDVFRPQAYAKSHKLKSSSDVILPVMQMMPYFTINSRACAVLILFFIKRSHWNSLMLETNDFLQTCFSKIALAGVIRSIRKLGFFLSVLTVFLIVL